MPDKGNQENRSMGSRRGSNDVSNHSNLTPARTSVDGFLAEASRAKVPTTHGTHRLLFAIDATASRQPTWDLACELHAELFTEAARLGNIAIQLCYYRGLSEFVASRWATTSAQLRDQMAVVTCLGGKTQLNRLLAHAVDEAAAHPVRALVFIGDCFEEDEAETVRLAGQLALRALPVFVFQERGDRHAHKVFAEMARITRGAHVAFDSNAPDQLRRLFGAIAHYAVGGRDALAEFTGRIGNAQTRALLTQLGPR
jgi:hypothetical protein